MTLESLQAQSKTLTEQWPISQTMGVLPPLVKRRVNPRLEGFVAQFT
jgi:hypothetical protein